MQLQLSIRTKLFLTFFIYGFVLIGISLYITSHISKNSIKSIAIDNAKGQYIKNRNIFRLYTDNTEAKLIAIKDSLIFQKHIDTHAHIDSDVNDLFLSIAKSDNFIMQLRFIDKNGNEIVRVDRNVCFALPYLVSHDKLQNKANRYYFKKIFDLQKDQFWISNLDLNVEHGMIERPLKPVLRMGTPIFKDGKKIGIVIINIFMKKLLDSLTLSKLYNIYIIDKDGYFILHPNPKYNWSRYLDKKVTVKDFFKDYKKILSRSEFQSQDLYSAKINFQNPDGLKMIIQPTQEFIHSTENDFYENVIILFIVLLLFSLPLTYWLAIPYIKVQTKLDHLNQELETEVKHKTKELQDLNSNLEETIKKRTHEQNILLSLFDLGDSVLFKWRADEHWSVEYVSKSVEKLLGFSVKSFVDGEIKYAECIHPEDLPRVIEEVETAIRKKLYFFNHKPYRVLTSDEKVKWIHDSTVIVRNKNKKIINFSKVSQI